MIQPGLAVIIGLLVMVVALVGLVVRGTTAHVQIEARTSSAKREW
jgi:hypothetical protein